MKRILSILLVSVLLAGCGVGTYSVSSGKPNQGYVCVIDDVRQDVVIKIDNQTYYVQSIKTKAYKSGRNIKKTALNSVPVTSGQHNVEVIIGNNVVLSKKVFISSGETKILEL